MTQQEQDAIIGRTVRQLAEKEKSIGAIRAELCRIGQALTQLGDELVRDPEHVVFEGQPLDVRYVITGKPAFQPADLNDHRIMDLTNDLRRNLQELQIIQDNARQMGIV